MSHRSHNASMNVIAKAWMVTQAVYGFLRLVKDPTQLDAVFRILDSLDQTEGGAEIVREFADNPRFNDVFVRRPRLGEINLAFLRTLPPGTLGRTYADEMTSRGLDPNAIEKKLDDGTPTGYVFAHLRETHDLWHTATGFDVDVAGELGLQVFYLTQFRARLPLVVLAMAFLNTLFFAFEDRNRRMDEVTRGWLLGRHANPFFGFDWAAHWNTPLHEVREMLGLQEPAQATRFPALTREGQPSPMLSASAPSLN